MNNKTYGNRSILLWVFSVLIFTAFQIWVMVTRFAWFLPVFYILLLSIFFFELLYLSKVKIYKDRFEAFAIFYKYKEVVYYKDILEIEPISIEYNYLIPPRHTNSYHAIKVTYKNGEQKVVKMKGILWFDKNKIMLDLSKHVNVVRFIRFIDIL